jgi:DNA modification methylase
MKNSSKQGDIVGDPFLGSGTTLIASEMNWRQC